MEELVKNLEETINRAKMFESEWENDVKAFQLKMKTILLGPQANVSQSIALTLSPQQMKKRPKRLSAVVDNDETFENPISLSTKSIVSEAGTVTNETIISEKPEKERETQQEPEHVFARPMRAAKLKLESLKEPPINCKLRRPDDSSDLVKKIKKEVDQRPSQSSTKKTSKANKSQLESLEANQTKTSNDSTASSKKIDESIVVIPENAGPLVEILSEEDDTSLSVIAKKKSKKEAKGLVIKVKKEKLSTSGIMESEPVPPIIATEPTEASTSEAITAEAPIIETKTEIVSSIAETISSMSSTNTTEPTRSKRLKKKKEFNHRPIKEERLSVEPPAPTPVSTRTRSGSVSKSRPVSVYEDAVDKLPTVDQEKTETPASLPLPQSAKADKPTANNNETVTTNNVTMVTACDSTFAVNQGNATFAMPLPQTTFVMEANPDATVTISKDSTKKVNGSIGDATFDLRDPITNESIMTEDDSFEKPIAKLKQPQPPATTKVLKTKSKPNELFNPCVQSPVKKKVEAFEHHAQKASNEMTTKTRSKKAKENAEPELPIIREIKSNMATTPVIGKPHAPALGRFLTPTQQSNATPSAGNARKLPNSASKIMPFPVSKQTSASSLKSTSSASSQSLSRENSEDDIKKGFNKLQALADERKKKRELKHQQAAAQREAKEKERAERLLKIMKEREEKNRKKAQEMEQKKRELEEINKNLKLQEEREQKKAPASKTKLDAAEAARQERELLEQMKMQKMKMPPPPKLHSKYNFNMLHSDDSTDEEGKTSYKRPTPPLWSKSSARADCIACQAYCATDIIDSFFSVQPMTPDLKAIFPNIDARYLKRNSSAIWRTPPRYSEMPKY